MGNFRIQLEIEGEPQFDRVFKRVDANFTDLTPVWEVVRDEFHEIMRAQFNSGGAAGASGAWKPLSEAYKKEKVRKYGKFATVGDILRASGDMYKTMLGRSGDSVVNIDKNSITIGAGGETGKRARYHQRGEGNLPQRKIIDFSEKQKTDLSKKIQKKMVELMRARGVPVE
jgi:phage gpG-like protein